MKGFNFGGLEGVGLVIVGGIKSGLYIYCPDYKGPSHRLTDTFPFLKWIDQYQHTMVDIPEDHDLDGWDNYWIMCSADCAFPPMYLVNAQNDCDALEEFCDGTHLTVVEEPDIDDYTDEDLHIDNNGRSHDTSSIHMIQVEMVAIYSVDLISQFLPKETQANG